MPLQNGAQVAAVRRLLGLSQSGLARLLDAGMGRIADLELSSKRREEFSVIETLFDSVGVVVCADEKNVVLVVPQVAGAAARAALAKKVELARAKSLVARQEARSIVRAQVLRMFEEFRGDRSDRQALDAFIADPSTASLLGVGGKPLRLSRRTMEGWLATWRRKGEVGLLPRWRGGRRPWYEKFPAARLAFLELLERTPKRSQAAMIAELHKRFADGVIDQKGRLCKLQLSQSAFGRAVQALRAGS